MKCISLWQPWASLVAIGAKPYETRSWAPPKALIGQRIAIHAAKKPLLSAIVGVGMETVYAMYQALEVHGLKFQELPFGAIVCTAALTAAREIVRHNYDRPNVLMVIDNPGAWGPLPEVPMADLFGDYSPGRWIWRLQDVQRLAVPVPCRWRQGFFEVEL